MKFSLIFLLFLFFSVDLQNMSFSVEMPMKVSDHCNYRNYTVSSCVW